MSTPGASVSLGNGFAVSSRFLIIVGFPDETSGLDNPVTRIFYLNLDSQTRFTYQDWAGETVVSACLRRPLGVVLRAGCFLSEEGRVEILNSTEHLSEDVDPRKNAYGSLRSIQEAGEILFACGLGGQLYRRSTNGWEAVDGGLRDKSERRMRKELGIGEFAGEDPRGAEDRIALGKESPDFTRVDGSSERDVYVCGLRGLIGYFDGSHLALLSSPTGEHLVDIHCVSHDRVLIVGYYQTLLIGNARSGFAVAYESNAAITFYSVREFRGEIYVGTTAGLRKFNGSKFEVVSDASAGLDDKTVIQQIDSVTDECLWLIGDRHVFRYDGVKAEKIELPDNRGR
ncbi:hypothetical protein [Rhizobium etli]|uniref:Uncharacterized protein n=1 Tax=Rhizobium etli TaxID=29449 RepID=A0A7W6VD39_RHIET|nr:hypothetical protein [Rhizobium etli]MBB4481144.1 hypothetical protein [Rhizobium etli]MBB4537241.1 hypothetical protein [Rhizobium etli]